MNNPNEANQIAQQNQPNPNNNIQNDEANNTNSNQIIQNGQQNLEEKEEEKINEEEEEKNNEISSDNDEHKQLLLKQKEQEALSLRKAQKQAQLQSIEKQYDEFLNNIINKWETDKNNFEQYFEDNILKNINSIINLPCIEILKDRICFIFKFLCKYFSFLKDNLKEIPLSVMHQAVYIYQSNLFFKNPNMNNININNQMDEHELIGDKYFYYIFKELLPNDEIENAQIAPGYNCMIKYFFEYLFHIGYNKKYITDFLSRDDFDLQSYLFFSDYSFTSLIKTWRTTFTSKWANSTLSTMLERPRADLIKTIDNKSQMLKIMSLDMASTYTNGFANNNKKGI